jgi:hypothetical protein
MPVCKRLVTAADYTVGPLVAVVMILESPSVLITILALALGLTWSLLRFVAKVVHAPTDGPTKRLCKILAAARGHK